MGKPFVGLLMTPDQIRLPIPSGGLEIKLKLKCQSPAKLADKMKVFIRNAYDYNFDVIY